MPSASAIQLQIESALAQKIPSTLTPATKAIRPVAETGIEPLDRLLDGGLPIGAVTELVGGECSGRTSTALSFLAKITQANKVCAWIDVSNAFDPASAAAASVDLARLLWVRCGRAESDGNRTTNRFAVPERYFVPRAPKKGLHGGGFGPHPRTEVNGLSAAIGELLQRQVSPRHVDAQRLSQPQRSASEPKNSVTLGLPQGAHRSGPWKRIEQALRSTDLILQAGGFSAIVLDMAGLGPEVVSRIELSTWHRYRVAAERTQSSILLLTQHPCAKSSSELQLRLLPTEDIGDETTVFTGIQPRIEVSRRRFAEAPGNILSIRKSPQQETTARWQSPTTWAACR